MAVLVILFVAAGALDLDHSSRRLRAPRRGCGEPPAELDSPPTAVTACTVAGVVLVAVLVNSNAQGAGPGPGLAPAVPLSAESLTSNLLAVEIHDANDVLFQANSEYRTYWQVAVLNVLRNGVWVPDPDTQNAAHGTTNGAAVTPSQGGHRRRGRSRDFKSSRPDRGSRQSHSPGAARDHRALGNSCHVDGRGCSLAHADDVGPAVHDPLHAAGDRT